ncbi:helix-turn-helix domain-containing protein [Phocaeicola oris]|uniref:helix-turn-helix domain-containing protein n=1 Tax=Phocaeicola oris TaxID=2896850 RepID=UPI00234F88DA|nr:helix-turn-helix domain-containing protein [Phocaeicola oris]MCE2615814.1 helix-turn-helix domain-containing protein [Phocaeicola oris]
MNKKTIKKLTFSLLNKAIEKQQMKYSDFYLDNSIGIINGGKFIFKDVLYKENPYEMEDARVGICKQGNAHIIINLIDHQFIPGDLIYLGKGSIIQIIELSSDLEIIGIAVSEDILNIAFRGQIPYIFNGQLKDFHIHIAKEKVEFIKGLIITALLLTKQKDFDKEVLNYLIATYYRYIYSVYSNSSGTKQQISHNQETFNKFIQLVNQNCKNKRSLAFYADKMCITQRYLGTIVKLVSNETAKDWIDKAVIMSAKVMLKHSDLQISQITDKLNFSTASFFCKYFKHHTGMTPQKYRES